jgi:parallel beta-helix repeat protein
MNRISICAVFIALVLAGLVVGVVEAAVILVDDDGVQCPGAIATIQDAVTSAAAGDTIRVCAGTYFEEVTIDSTKTNLRLIGAGRVQLGAPLVGISPFGFDVAAAGVQIDRFEIFEFGQCGIRVTADGARIQNNYLHHNEVNICVEGSTDTRVRKNILHASVGPGVLASQVSANEISGNRVSASDSGIVVTEDSGSTIHHNLVAGVAFGIVLGFSAGGSIRNNTVRFTEEIGVLAFQGTDVEIVSNSVRDAVDGMFVHGCVGCTLSRNSVVRSVIAGVPFGGGIFLEEIDGTAIIQNAAHRNGVIDCSWDGVGSNVFLRNSCGVEAPPGAWD